MMIYESKQCCLNPKWLMRLVYRHNPWKTYTKRKGSQVVKRKGNTNKIPVRGRRMERGEGQECNINVALVKGS